MENLFSDDPQFRRIQYKKLSDNAREWQQEVSALVAERLPKDLGLDVTVVFQKVDDEKGYGIGTAIASDPNAKVRIGIPIIIKAWHVAPFDLFFREGVVMPLTDDNLAKTFFKGSMGAGVASEKPPPNMADDVFADVRTPPLGGKYSYSSPFSALDTISGTLGAEDIEHYRNSVQSNNQVLAGFHRHGTFDLACKYAAEKPSAGEQDEINKKRAVSLFTIKKDGPDLYRMYTSPDGVYDPILISTDRQGLKHFLEMRKGELWDFEQDPLNSIDRYGHFTIVPPKGVYGLDVDGISGAVKTDGAGAYGAELGKHKNPWVFDPLQDDRLVRTIDRFGRYGVKDSDGVLAKGWVLPNVVGFDGQAKPMKLFLGKALSAMQGRIAGIPLNDDADVALHPDSPDTGKIGTLVYRDGERILATCPFQVTAVTVFKNLRALSVVDYQGNEANLILSPAVDGIVPVTNSKQPELGPLMGPKKNYIVSAKMFFVKMPKLSQVSEGPDDFKRLAVEHLDKNPVKVAHSNGHYVFRGGMIPKLARSRRLSKTASPGKRVEFDFNYLPRHEAEFLLGSWGLGHQKIAEVLDGVHERIQLEVHHLRFPTPPGHKKVGSAKLRSFIADMRPSIPAIVKIAASLENAQTVDTILSLGFMNEENIGRFAAARPMLEETAKILAKILLAARLGMEDIPEESARLALMHLQRVIEGLSKVKMITDSAVKVSFPNHMLSASEAAGLELAR